MIDLNALLLLFFYSKNYLNQVLKENKLRKIFTDKKYHLLSLGFFILILVSFLLRIRS